MAMPTITTKQHDTRPIRTITLYETNPINPATVRVVDLTTASSAKLLAKIQGSATSFSSVLAIASDPTTGQVVWTPVVGDTAVAGAYQAEVEITWSGGGVETYPNDTYFTIIVVADLG